MERNVKIHADMLKLAFPTFLSTFGIAFEFFIEIDFSASLVTPATALLESRSYGTPEPS